MNFFEKIILTWKQIFLKEFAYTALGQHRLFKVLRTVMKEPHAQAVSKRSDMLIMKLEEKDVQIY